MDKNHEEKCRYCGRPISECICSDRENVKYSNRECCENVVRLAGREIIFKKEIKHV